MTIIPQRIKFAANKITCLQPEKHLDIGCGSGLLLRELNGEIYCVGLELSEAKARLCDVNTRIVIGNACHLPFVGNAFDSVSALEVIEHVSVSALDDMVRNVHNSLKNRGVVTISTPFYDLRSILLDPAWYFGHRHFSGADLIRLFNPSKGWECSFTVVRGGWWEVLMMLNYYISKYLFNRDIFVRAWFESRRTREYLEVSRGFTTMHAQFVKNI